MVHSKSQVSMVLCDFHFHIKFHRGIKIVYFFSILIIIIWKLFWPPLGGSNLESILSIIGFASGIGYIYSHFKLVYLIENLKIYYKKIEPKKLLIKLAKYTPRLSNI